MRTAASLVAVVAATALAAAGCGGGTKDAPATTTTSHATAPERITVLGSTRAAGPYGHSIALKLVDGLTPIPFYVCAAWGAREAPGGCHAKAGAKLPLGTELRLEQHPAGPAVPAQGSPGWGTVGSSDTPELSVPLSNGVTGNKLGKVTFRATLRNQAGRVLATSNTFTLTWHS